jgi:hypothetical protein
MTGGGVLPPPGDGNGGQEPPEPPAVTSGGEPPAEPSAADRYKARAEEVASNPEARDRRKQAEAFPLDPGSLLGSWFHKIENNKITQEGLVIGQPEAGHYLLSVTSGLEGAEKSTAQVIVRFEHMVTADEGYEFRFYDAEDLMRAAYAEFVGPLSDDKPTEVKDRTGKLTKAERDALKAEHMEGGEEA